MDLLETLRAACAGLLWQSETDAALHPLVWNTDAAVGADALRALLKIPPAIPIADTDAASALARMGAQKDWHGDEERAIAARFRALAALLEDVAPQARALRVGAGPDIALYVVGRTADGHRWAGFATHVTET